jgi:hypothetical protein
MLNLGLFLLFLHLDASAIQRISDSGRCADLGESPRERIAAPPAIAPGPPPLLSFRFYEGKLHHRFGNADLMLDDAGH